MKREDIAGGMPLNPEALDRQAAMEDARLVLGVIGMLEGLDDAEPAEPLAAQIARLEKWLEQPAWPRPDAASRQILGGLLG